MNLKNKVSQLLHFKSTLEDQIKCVAQQNIKIHGLINFLAGVTFLIPVVTLFYRYIGLSMFDIIVLSNITTFGIFIFELPTSVFADTSGRKKSLTIALVANLLGAFCYVLFPSFFGFVIAAICTALYWSFWSGTGQAFLEENLRVLGKEKDFGKVIGKFMFYEQLAALITPVIASIILKYCGELGYSYLAILDLFFAAILVSLVLKLRETTILEQKNLSFNKALQLNIITAKSAIQNVFTNSKLKTVLLYRSFANHVAFLPLLILPLLLDMGMLEWYSGILVALATIVSMFASKYAYVFGEKFSYKGTWIFSTIMQAILLISIGLLFGNWMIIAFLYVLFNVFEGLWQPAWNHVLVELTNGSAIATTRSIIFGLFALYATIGKQVLSIFEVQHAFIVLGIFILLMNFILRKKMVKV